MKDPSANEITEENQSRVAWLATADSTVHVCFR